MGRVQNFKLDGISSNGVTVNRLSIIDYQIQTQYHICMPMQLLCRSHSNESKLQADECRDGISSNGEQIIDYRLSNSNSVSHMYACIVDR